MYENPMFDCSLAIERRKDEITFAEEYRRGSLVAGGKIKIDQLIKLLKTIGIAKPPQLQPLRHTPAPASHILAFMHFEHFMHRNFTRHHSRAQWIR